MHAIVLVDDDNIRAVIDPAPIVTDVPRVTRATLIHNQIKNLPTAPITLAAAPGVGMAHFILGARFAADCRSGVYAGFTGYSAIEIAVASTDLVSTGQSQNTILPDALIGQLGFTVQQSAPYYQIGSGDYDGELVQGAAANTLNYPDENLPIVIFGFNGAQVNFTSGHANNTLKVTVWYYTMDV